MAALTKEKISERLLTIIAFIFGLAYVFYCAIFWGRVYAQGDPYALIAIYVLAPHFIATAVAVVLTALALFLGRSWWNLAAGVVYVIGIACFPAYWFFLIVPAVLSFFAFYRMRKLEKSTEPIAQAALDDALDAQSVDAPNMAMEDLADQADMVPAAAAAAPEGESVADAAQDETDAAAADKDADAE